MNRLVIFAYPGLQKVESLQVNSTIRSIRKGEDGYKGLGRIQVEGGGYRVFKLPVKVKYFVERRKHTGGFNVGELFGVKGIKTLNVELLSFELDGKAYLRYSDDKINKEIQLISNQSWTSEISERLINVKEYFPEYKW